MDSESLRLQVYLYEEYAWLYNCLDPHSRSKAIEEALLLLAQHEIWGSSFFEDADEVHKILYEYYYGSGGGEVAFK